MQSSTYTTDAHTQPSGARYVYERHTDATGRVHQLPPWLAPAGWGDAEITAVITARAAQIDAQLAEAEAAALMGE